MEHEIKGHYFHVRVTYYSIYDEELKYEIEKYYPPGQDEPSDDEVPKEIRELLEFTIWEELEAREA